MTALQASPEWLAGLILITDYLGIAGKWRDVVAISSLCGIYRVWDYLKRRHGSRLVWGAGHLAIDYGRRGGFSKWHPLAFIFVYWIMGIPACKSNCWNDADLKHVIESGVHKPDSAFTCGIGVLPERAAEVHPVCLFAELEASVRTNDHQLLRQYWATNNLHDFINYMGVWSWYSSHRRRWCWLSAVSVTARGHENAVLLGIPTGSGLPATLRYPVSVTLPSKVGIMASRWTRSSLCWPLNILSRSILAIPHLSTRRSAVSLPMERGWQNVSTALPRATRDAAGLAGREWLLEHQNYDTLARDYLQKIEACLQGEA